MVNITLSNKDGWQKTLLSLKYGKICNNEISAGC